ncbi:MAG: ArnT family glycosyltransferase [Myxococcota bacterium]
MSDRLGRGAARWVDLLALALGAAALGVNLDAGSLMNSDDVLYAQMAREMARTGRWAETVWMGTVLFEKPPLLFWLLRGSGGLLAWSEGAMRLPGVLAGVISLAYVLRLTRAAIPADLPLGRTVGPAVAVALTVATVIFTMNARRPLTDPLLTAAVLAVAWHGHRAALTGWLSQAAALGLAGGLGLLAKQVAIGPAVLVAAVALVLRGRGKALAVAVGVGVLVAAPWHVLMTARHGAAFWDVYLGYHVASRAAGALVGDAGPLYYLQTAWELDGAVALVLLAGLLAATALAIARRGREDAHALGVVVATAGVTILALHLASTRLFHYLMPVAPLAAVATVAGARSTLERPWVPAALGGLAVLGFLSGPLVPHLTDPDYSATSRRLGQGPLADLPADTRLVVWESYDPALVWYADHPARIWTRSRRFWEVQRAVDMMRRADAVRLATPEALADLARNPGPVVIVAPSDRTAGLDAWLATVAEERSVASRDLPGMGRRIVRLEARR